MRCDAAIKKCEWVGTVATLKNHEEACNLMPIPCPQKCKDDANVVKVFLRRDLKRHLDNECPNREYECEYCGEKGTHVHITQVHDKTCAQKILPCPSPGCAEAITRQNLKKHVSDDCPYTVVPCKYKRLGCDAEMARKDMANHEMDSIFHIEVATDTTDRLKLGLARLEQKVDRLEQNVDGLTQNMDGLEQHANRLEWNVDGLQRHASRLKRNVKGLNWNFMYALLLTLCFLFALHRWSVNSNISLLEKKLVRVESTKSPGSSYRTASHTSRVAMDLGPHSNRPDTSNRPLVQQRTSNPL